MGEGGKRRGYTEYLDPQLLPFIQETLFRALALTAGEQEASAYMRDQ